jgi:MSHA biogenesis protein MshO
MKRLPSARGFTLVEAVIAIAIIGIIGAIVAVFIRMPILNYRDTVDRAEITDQADLALRRMARDIRLALPNSVRVSADGSALELLQTRSGGRYLASDDGVDPSLVLSFDDRTKNTFAALAPPTSFSQVRVGDYVVVYNLGDGYEPANAYQLAAAGTGACPGGSASAAGNIARICGLSGATDSIAGQSVPTVHLTLAGNPFALQDVQLQSPLRRFQVVSGPVSFYCAAQPDGSLALWRAWGYPISSTQAVPAGGQRALVATRLTHCGGLFSYGTAAAQRSGLVGIALELHGRNDNAAAIRLVHQVHVDNTP